MSALLGRILCFIGRHDFEPWFEFGIGRARVRVRYCTRMECYAHEEEKTHAAPGCREVG